MLLDHAPEDVTRVLFEDFSILLIGIFYVIGFTAIGVFLYGVWAQIRK
jgi:hypothetical protein